jgi:hypothetical protein
MSHPLDDAVAPCLDDGFIAGFEDSWCASMSADARQSRAEATSATTRVLFLTASLARSLFAAERIGDEVIEEARRVPITRKRAEENVLRACSSALFMKRSDFATANLGGFTS